MNILVFSDTHLSGKFEEKKYNYLVSLIKQADYVIINGDLWEGFTMTFEQFVHSAWNRLFPLLKEKKAVYIYGNHDKKIFSDERVQLFSDIQTHRYELQIDTTTFIFEHGNRHAPLLDEWLGIERAHPFVQHAFLIVQNLLVKYGGKNSLKLVFGKYNKQIKKRLRGELEHNHLYVCGHTHVAEIDLENQFINSGIIQHGLGQHLWIREGNISLHEGRYY